MNAISKHGSGVTVILGAIGNDDGGLGGGVSLDPAGDELVELNDGGVLEREGNELVNLWGGASRVSRFFGNSAPWAP